MSGYNIGQALLYYGSGKPLSPSERELLTCSSCHLILRDAYQATECEHRYCYSCIEDILATSSPRCVIDDEEISRSKVRKDRGCTKELANLLVDCPGREFGCGWQGFLPDLEEHLSKCELGYYNLCGECVPEMKMKERTTTGNSCSELSLACPVDSCNKKGNLTTLNKHVAQHHLFHVATLILQLKQEIEERDAEIKELKSVTKTICEDMERLKDQLCHLEPPQYLKTASLSSHLFSADSPHSAYSYDSAYSSHASSVLSTRGDGGASLNPRLEAIEQKVETKVEPLPQTLQQSLVRVDELTQTVQETVTRHAVSMEEIKLRQDVLDVKNTSGAFIWKIPDVRKRLRDAVERHTLSLYSPPFYSSPHGYRMCIRAYLKGDGSGKGSHFSVFFVVMRSEHDSLLRWPFSQPVTFTLVNQAFPPKSISETFLPDDRSPSFLQPRSEMNVASGFPRFAPQSLLHEDNYMKGNFSMSSALMASELGGHLMKMLDERRLKAIVKQFQKLAASEDPAVVDSKLEPLEQLLGGKLDACTGHDVNLGDDVSIGGLLLEDCDVEKSSEMEGGSDSTQNADQVKDDEEPCGEGSDVFDYPLSIVEDQHVACSELVMTISGIGHDDLNPLVW